MFLPNCPLNLDKSPDTVPRTGGPGEGVYPSGNRLAGVLKVCILCYAMRATLTELRRQTTKFVRPVINGQGNLTVTEHGQPCLQVVPVPRIDRKAALEALRAMGPVKLPPRR